MATTTEDKNTAQRRPNEPESWDETTQALKKALGEWTAISDNTGQSEKKSPDDKAKEEVRELLKELQKKLEDFKP